MKQANEQFLEALVSNITEIFKKNQNYRFSLRELSSIFRMTDQSGKKTLTGILKTLVDQGIINKESRGKYHINLNILPHHIGIVTGYTAFALFVTSNDFKKDVMIPNHESSHALYGDTVSFIITSTRHDGKMSGSITKIIKRSEQVYVGMVFSLSPSSIFLKHSSKFLPYKVALPRKLHKDLVEGDMVTFHIESWEDGDDIPTCTLIERLGKEGDNDTEMHAILIEYGLPYQFSQEVLDASNSIPGEITELDLKKRRDMRCVTTFTIDPADAKDFDDALSLRFLNNGCFEVGIHIADVTHYVQEDNIINEEAIKRGTSVYLVDRTVPMLPERLSNFLCSLRPNEDKLCFSAVFELDGNAELRKEWFGHTVIRSDRRFSYEEAQNVIESGEGDLKEEILTLHHLAQCMRKRRFSEGSVAFDRKEAKFTLDENGHPEGVYFKVQKETNQLIEEFMLLANRRVATFCAEDSKGKERTMVFRVHDNPDEVKFERFRSFIRKFGHNFRATKGVRIAKELNALMKDIKGKPEENIVSELAIRAMAKATYSTDNIGHYGLGFEYYTHFTSPIRRYPDMMVHRLLDHYLKKGKSADAAKYESLCVHSSDREVVAAEAERASIKYKMTEYMSDHIGEQFRGHISGFNETGMFVELEDGIVEGIVTYYSMNFDMFEFEHQSFEVIGIYTGQKYSLGDEVIVEVYKTNLRKRLITFTLIAPVTEYKSKRTKAEKKKKK